jgi:hypothetical protein
MKLFVHPLAKAGYGLNSVANIDGMATVTRQIYND